MKQLDELIQYHKYHLSNLERSPSGNNEYVKKAAEGHRKWISWLQQLRSMLDEASLHHIMGFDCITEDEPTADWFREWQGKLKSLLAE